MNGKLAFARSMRRAPVTTEALLWKLLRDRRLGDLKFRRQVPIGRYVADFVCLRHRLVVEADGLSHDQQIEYDAERDRWFQSEGFRVLRFSNQDVHEETEAVLETILRAVQPSPPAGEGGGEAAG